MEKQITVKIKSIFGIDKIYPVCSTSKKLTKLLGQLTFTERNIEIIEELGYSIIVAVPKLKGKK